MGTAQPVSKHRRIAKYTQAMTGISPNTRPPSVLYPPELRAREYLLVTYICNSCIHSSLRAGIHLDKHKPEISRIHTYKPASLGLRILQTLVRVTWTSRSWLVSNSHPVLVTAIDSLVPMTNSFGTRHDTGVWNVIPSSNSISLVAEI